MKINPYTQEVWDKIQELEAMAHPPIQFEECPKCHAIIAPGKVYTHLRKLHREEVK